MFYDKPALSYEEQVDQLLERGLIANRDTLISHLKNVSYYRLSGYWFPFRDFPKDSFKNNTKLDVIWRRYTFDRHLRLLLLDGIERIEISLRADVTYRLAHEYGAFGYLNKETFPKLKESDFLRLITQLKKEYSRSKETFTKHFREKYSDEHDMIPIWMVTEIMTFGNLYTMIRGIKIKELKKVAKLYNLNNPLLLSWMGTLNAIRNICAHHSRLWNRELGYKPTLPDNDERWHSPIEIGDNRVFAILTIIKYMLDIIAPQSQWPQRNKSTGN